MPFTVYPEYAAVATDVSDDVESADLALSTGAAGIGYNNAVSGLTAATLQAAVDEIIADLAATTGAAIVGYDNAVSGLTAATLQAAVDEIIADLAATTGAATVGYDNAVSGLTAATLQAAVDEIIADLAATTGAATVGYDNAVSGLTAATLQAAVDEIIADLAATTGAAAVGYDNGVSGLTAATAQAAVDELASEKADLAGATFTGAAKFTKSGSAAFETVTGLVDATDKGVVTQVLDCTVTLVGAVASIDLPVNIPNNAIIRTAQVNHDTIITATTAVKVGIGTAGDPDKYGLSADLLKNTKIDSAPAAALLASGEDVLLFACDNAGSAAGTINSGTFHVRIVVDVLVSLADAA